MKRKNDLYITENMLQASLQSRQKTSQTWKVVVVAGILIFAASSVYLMGYRPF